MTFEDLEGGYGLIEETRTAADIIELDRDSRGRDDGKIVMKRLLDYLS